MKLKHFYERQYKKLLFVPFILLILALVQIGVQYSVTGDFVNKGISLKGGSTISFDYEPGMDIAGIESSLASRFPRADLSIRTLSSAGAITSVAVDSDAQENEEIEALQSELQRLLPGTSLSVEVTGSSLGDSFFKQTLIALIVAFSLMALVVFVYFRSIAPSLAVILAASSDIIVTLAIFNLTGIKLSSAGIAAFLMLIGYSVDTDILLSSRVLKRKQGTVMERIYGAMKTGLTMSATTLTAVIIGVMFVQSDIVKQIMVILLIGLLVDLPMTWLQNTGILRLYLERKKDA